MTEIKGVIFDWRGTLYQGSRGVFPHSKDVLSRLKEREYQIALITSVVGKKGIDKRHTEIARADLKSYFDPLIVVEAKTVDHYSNCIREMHTSPERALVVSNDLNKGINMGNQLGCKTLLIQRNTNTEKFLGGETEKPSGVIRGVEELLLIL